MIRQAANLLVLGFLLAVTLAAGLGWGLGTESGALWLVRQAKAWMPGLSVARVEGVVLGRFAVQGLDFRNATERVHLDRLAWRLDPGELWHGVLHVRSLQIHKPQYASMDDAPIAWPNLHLPIDLVIDEIKVTDAALPLAGDDAPTRLEALDAALSLTREGLEIRRFAWRMPALTGELSGHLAMGGLEQVKLKTVWDWHPPGKPAFQGEGYAGGNLDRVIIRQTLRAPLSAELSMVLMQPLDRLTWTAQLDMPEFPANTADPSWPAWPVTLSLQGEGTGESAVVGGNFAASIPGAGSARGEWRARYRLPGELVLEQLALNLPATKSALQISGTVHHLQHNPEFNASAQWTNLVWPLDRTPEWRSAQGKLSVTGTPKALRFDAEGLLADRPVTAAGLLGLSPGRTEFRGVRAQGAGLSLQLDGQLGPQMDLTWALQGDQIGVWLPGGQGQISSRGHLQGPLESLAGVAELSVRGLRYRDAATEDLVLHAQGGLTPGAPPIAVDVAARGVRYGDNELREAKLGFRGGLVFRGGRLQLESPTAELQLNGVGLRYQGNFFRELLLQVRGGLLPGSPPMAGQLKAAGLRLGETGVEMGELTLDFTGGLVQREGRIIPQGQPLEVRLAAASFVQGERQARDIRLEVRAGGQPNSPVSLSLRIPDARLDGARLSLELEGQGTLARHSLVGRIDGHLADLASTRRPANLVLRAEGGWAAAAWSGELRQFDGVLAGLGDWRLIRPVPLRVGSTGGELGLACWESGGAEACWQARLSESGAWQTAVRIGVLPLERWRPWLPAEAVLKGALDADLQISGQGDRLADGHIDVTVTSALIGQQGGAAPLSFKPQPLVLRGQVTPRGAELRLTAEQIGMAALRAELDLDGPVVLSRLGQTPITGEAFLEVPNLGVLLPLMTDIDKLQGRLTGGVRFAGTPEQPRLQVHGTLFDGGFSVPRLGIKVRSLNADAISRDNNQLSLSGRAVSGSGELKLDGSVTLSPRADWPLLLTLRGQRFLAADIPEARLYLSPDLTIERKDSRLSLTGKLTIPEAIIRIPDESGAIKPSRDVVILVGNTPPEARSNPLETRVDVVLGNKINVTGPGYQARLDGQVTIEQSPGQDAVGSGEIKIHDGKYSLYGVDLEVDGGRLVFARSPMDNPNLDIRAVRKSDNVQAGAKLLGTLNRPNITLFADRPMSQTDILAYMIMGKPFDPLAREEGSAMKGAASALGGSAGSLLAKELSSRLGLGSFVDISMQNSLGAGGIAQNYTGSGPWGGTQGTALFLGKYLTPKIYVQYGMGLFQNAYVFRLRYDLTQRWKIQTETGVFSGGDILYQWED